MQNVLQYKSISEFLVDELSSRCLQNSQYSIRSFAKDLGIGKSTLWDIISKKGNVRLSTVSKISTAMKLSTIEKEYLKMIWQVSHTKNEKLKKHAQSKFSKYTKLNKFTRVENKQIDLLSQWYYLPIIEIISSIKTASIEGIAKALNISPTLVNEAIRFLSENRYIEESPEGNWVKFEKRFKIESKTKNQKIRSYHKNFLHLASLKIDEQNIEDRKFLTTNFAMKKENVAAARNELEVFLSKFLNKYSEDISSDSVYSLGIQFYKVIS